jgi:hypothetical protein
VIGDDHQTLLWCGGGQRVRGLGGGVELDAPALSSRLLQLVEVERSTGSGPWSGIVHGH